MGDTDKTKFGDEGKTELEDDDKTEFEDEDKTEFDNESPEVHDPRRRLRCKSLNTNTSISFLILYD